MLRGGRNVGLMFLVLSNAVGCGKSTTQPADYQASFERDDGTRQGSSTIVDAEPSVERTDVAAYVARNADRGRLSPASQTAATLLDRRQHLLQLRDFVREHASTKQPGELVRVVLNLGDLPFPELAYFRNLTPEQRQLVIEDRKARLELEQRGIVRYLESIGAVVHENPGAFNHVRTEIPAHRMEEVLARPEIEEVQPSWERAVPLWDLDEGREATFISEFWDQGIEGDFGSRSWGSDGSELRQKVAVIEVPQVGFFFGVASNRLDEEHPGWGDSAGGPTRAMANLDCLGLSGLAGCPSQPTNGYGVHGTWVASVLTGDITEGQDPTITDPLERLRRTGMAPEAALYYLNASYPDEIAVALFNAVARGADVINLSLASPCPPACSPVADCGGINQMIRFATDSGALVVAAAGNENFFCIDQGPPFCSVCQPALRPEVLAVGNVHSFAGFSYEDANIHPLSSRGSIRVGVAGQHAGNYPNGVDVPAVSIAAPGTFGLFFFGNAQGYLEPPQYQTGTSLAAPVVAGAAVLMRQEMGYTNPFFSDAHMLRAKILAMGDGTGVISGGRVGEVFGTGKAKFHAYDSLVAPKGQGHQQFTLHENEIVTLDASHFPGSLPPEATQWKMGMDIRVHDYSAIPYVLLTYQDVCGGTRWLATDWRAGLERYMTLESSSFDSDTCIRISVSGYSIPAGGVTISVYDYYHSGDPADH